MALVQFLSAFNMKTQIPAVMNHTDFQYKTGTDGDIDLTASDAPGNVDYAAIFLQGNILYDSGQVSPYGTISTVYLDGTDSGIFPDIVITGLSYSLSVADFNNDLYHGNFNRQISLMLAGNDVIIGSSGVDTLWGYAGNDTLIGGAGGDSLDGGGGLGDTASYSTASSGVVAELNNPTFNTGDAAGDRYTNIFDLIGSKYSDVLYGSSAANSLYGGDGDDFLIGVGSSSDTLNGGNGRDTASYDLAPGPVRVDLITPSANSGDAAGDVYISIENIYGSPYDDYLYGDNTANLINGGATATGTGNDHVYGLGGNDTVYGSDGNDYVDGGDNNDSLNGGDGTDVIRGGAGKDAMDGGAGTDTLDYTDKTQKVQLALNGATAVTVLVNGVAEDSVKNFERVLGGSAGDVLTGDGLANLFYGYGGNDSIASGSGNDTVRGGTGADVMDGGSGSDTTDYSDKSSAIAVTLNGATAVFVKVGAANEDSIKNFENVIGGSGADHIVGDGLANTIRGGVGKDVLDGGAGIDTADYSDKTQKVTVTLNGATAVSVFINGTAAANVEDSIKNFERVYGGSAGDKLTGDGLANLFIGNGGNDSLSGGGGDDVLIGGIGQDSMTGGSGADHFQFAWTADIGFADIITDFVPGTDRIEISDATTVAHQINANNFGYSASSTGDFDDVFVYNVSAGVLFYDFTPGVAGNEVPIAVFTNHAVISFADIWEI